MSFSQQKLEANFSVLTMSLASSAVMALGLAPDPQTQKIHKDKNMAKFNIDLLIMLRDKTKGNLSSEESQFIESVISDLQIKFVQENKT
jgi:hypothetical protein